jgi:C-terminal processing protease CtpA/Prc
VLLAVDGTRAARSTLWKIRYLLNTLRPQREVRLLLAAPGGTRELTVQAKVTPGKRYADFEEYLLKRWKRQQASVDSRFHDVGPVLVWKLESFSVDDDVLEAGLRRAQARGRVVLDLRGNPGGFVDALEWLVGAFVPSVEPVTIGALRKRDKTTTLFADRRRGDQVFRGPLVVLVDSESGSAAEIFARLVQLRGRGRVVGDRTAGAVMVSSFHALAEGHVHRFVQYGLSVTLGALVLPDGSTLEGRGVVPDETDLPGERDLREGHDPVLARAVRGLGGDLDDAAAGRLFPDD